MMHVQSVTVPGIQKMLDEYFLLLFNNNIALILVGCFQYKVYFYIFNKQNFLLNVHQVTLDNVCNC